MCMRSRLAVFVAVVLQAGCVSEGPLDSAPNLPSPMAEANQEAAHCPWPKSGVYSHTPKHYTSGAGGGAAVAVGCSVVSFKIDARGAATDVAVVQGSNAEIDRYAITSLASMRFDPPDRPQQKMLFKVGVVRRFLRGDRPILWCATGFW